jgi:hypothetical protein
MNDKNQEVRNSMDMIKNSFKEMGLPVLSETENEEGIGVIGTQIDTNLFSMFVEVACGRTSSELEIKVGFSVVLTADNYFGLLQVLNIINGHLMDIGHFAVNPSDGDISFQTSVEISDKDLRSNLIINSLVRLISQGIEFFGLLLRLAEANQCPLTELRTAINEMYEKAFKGGKE